MDVVPVPFPLISTSALEVEVMVLSVIVMPSAFNVVADTVLKVPASGTDAPITVLSMPPELMSLFVNCTEPDPDAVSSMLTATG